MNDLLYNPFLAATRNVFQLMLDLTDISDSPADSFIGDDKIDIVIGVIGDLEGEVIYRFPFETSLSMVNIMSGMEIISIDDFVTSAISEIANIISGNVLSMLAEEDFNCDILPPVLREPEENTDYELRTTCCIITSVGKVFLDIRLNPSLPKDMTLKW